MESLFGIPAHWILLALIGYVALSVILYTLAMQYRNAVRVHDLIHDSKHLRAKYLEAQNAAQEQQKSK